LFSMPLPKPCVWRMGEGLPHSCCNDYRSTVSAACTTCPSVPAGAVGEWGGAACRERPDRLVRISGCRPGRGIGGGQRAAWQISRSEVLLVAHVGNRAFVLLAVTARRERVLAAGDEVVGADSELAAPRGAPGQADAQALPLLLAGGADDLADDAGAEGAVGAADREGLAVPVVGQPRGDLAGGNQLRPGQGAGDGDGALAARVCLCEDREVADVGVVAAAGIGREPCREVG